MSFFFTVFTDMFSISTRVLFDGESFAQVQDLPGLPENGSGINQIFGDGYNDVSDIYAISSPPPSSLANTLNDYNVPAYDPLRTCRGRRDTLTHASNNSGWSFHDTLHIDENIDRDLSAGYDPAFCFTPAFGDSLLTAGSTAATFSDCSFDIMTSNSNSSAGPSRNTSDAPIVSNGPDIGNTPSISTTGSTNNARTPCPYCPVTVKRSHDLKRHMLRHQAGAKRYLCPARDCKYQEGGKGFMRKDKPIDHIRARHSDLI